MSLPAYLRRSTGGAMGFLRRPSSVSAFAATLVIMAAPGPAVAQCTGLCADQAGLLSAFTALPNSPAGQALLNANLQTEENIYLNSTQAQKVVGALDFIVQDVPTNILIGAFPTNPKF